MKMNRSTLLFSFPAVLAISFGLRAEDELFGCLSEAVLLCWSEKYKRHGFEGRSELQLAKEFSEIAAVNLEGVANVIRHFVPAMIACQRGIIVNFSSGWGRSTAAARVR